MSEKSSEFEKIKSYARLYFPDTRFTGEDDSLETEDKGEILYRKTDILPYLQTMFFEEHLVEFEQDQGTRIFFGRMLDDIPDLVEEETDDGEILIVEPDCEPGEYLKTGKYFLITPLTPAIGNALVRNAAHIVVRFFSGTIAIELGCTFAEQTEIRDQPALKFNFPEIGRVNRNFRSYRVKAGTRIEAKAAVRNETSNSLSESYYAIYDVSSGGLAIEIPEGSPTFREEQILQLKIMVEGMKELQVAGTVRNTIKVREKKGYRNICGIQIDLESRALATDMEKLATMLQRVHLREMAEKTDNLEGVSLIR